MYAQLPFAPFSAYSGNPVVTATSGEWDQSAVWWCNVIVVNDTFYLTYDGTSSFPTTPASIGLAVSSDGFTFSKSLSNPILSGDGSGFDAYSADGGVIFFDNSVWYIYYSGKSVTISQPGNVIGRATSNISPHGPWTRNNDTLLTVGSAGEWDSEFIIPACIAENGTELVMYYFAGSYWPGPGQIGMAVSTNGGTSWQKYDDPTTTSPPYAESDPVLKPDKPYDDFSILGCSVLKTLTGWEMFYAGYNDMVSSICYATSLDGINWVKDDSNPIFVPSQDPLAYDLFEKPAVVLFDYNYFMYYDYGVSPTGIGLAMADVVVPVELISFTATTNGREVTLSWSTATELNNLGFEIQRSTTANEFFTVGFIEGNGTTTEQNTYSFTDRNLSNGKNFYRLKQVDYDGSYEYSNIIEVEWRAFNSYLLEQNYPNPFNPTTTIGFGVQNKSNVKITILNSIGEEVAVVLNEEREPGFHQVEFNAANLPSGVYFYQLRAGSYVGTKKMLLLR
jgi:predicted GH43/DUF377 family glycosyl hydrolase